MGKLGISIYPEKSTLTADKRYCEKAASLGYTRLFTSLLQAYFHDAQDITDRLRTSVAMAKSLGFEIIVDVSPHIFKVLKVSLDDLSFFADIGVDGLRLDMGFTGKEESRLTRNPEGLSIEINMSQSSHYLDQIMDFSPLKDKLIGCHNFYPQAYTGLDTDYFIECSKPFRDAGIRSAAFITSHTGTQGPWSIQEGLCTVEEHRCMPVEDQVRHLKMTGLIDDIIFGNAFASDEELEEAAAAFYEKYPTFTVSFNEEATDLEKKIVTETVHTYRGDRSSYMIRSSMPRLTYREEIIPAHQHHQTIQPGDLLILNRDYGQYKGEMQIALKTRPGDARVNIVGKIEDVTLLKYLRVYEDFRCKEGEGGYRGRE